VETSFFDQISSLTPAPILLDIRMTGMDGFQVLGELEARKVKWPVVVVSGRGDIASAVRAMRFGAIDFLEKPSKIGALRRAWHSRSIILRRLLLFGGPGGRPTPHGNIDQAQDRRSEGSDRRWRQQAVA